MIERYTLPALREIWTDERRYALWTRVEVAVCRALAARGVIPQKAFETIESRARVEAALRPHEAGALECILGGYGLPFYTEDQQVQVFPENSAVLKRGVVVPCDRSLHDQAGFDR